MRLGYNNVERMPAGWFGWLELTQPGQPVQAVAGLTVGDPFPGCNLVLLNSDADRAYLDLPDGRKSYALSEVPSQFMIISLYQELCDTCVKEVAVYNRLVADVAEDPFLKGRLKVIAFGVGSTKPEVHRFRKQRRAAYPMFADRNREIFDCLGQPVLPMTYLVRKNADGSRKILLTHSGHIADLHAFIDKVKAQIAATPP